MFENRVIATLGAFIVTGIFILLEHFNGGVVSHHLLASEDLPKISNWWGLLTIPSLTWILCSMIKRRNNILSHPSQNLKTNTSIWQTNFLAALVFGVSLSALWEFGYEYVLQYFILVPFVVAIFKPVHYPEVLLGFVIGLIYTFGGILPIIIGLVLLIICFVINKLIGWFMTLFNVKPTQAN